MSNSGFSGDASLRLSKTLLQELSKLVPDLAKDTQVVFAEDFQNCFVAVAAVEQTLGDVRQIVHAGEVGGRAVDAEEVGAEADMVGADGADGGVDVVEKGIERRLTIGDDA